MSEFWIGVLLGIWVGSPVGFVVAALLAANKRKDDYE